MVVGWGEWWQQLEKRSQVTEMTEFRVVAMFISTHVAIVDVVSRCGFIIGTHHRNQPKENKLALYKLLLSFYSHMKQSYISNKKKHFSYEGDEVYIYGHYM